MHKVYDPYPAPKFFSLQVPKTAVGKVFIKEIKEKTSRPSAGAPAHLSGGGWNPIRRHSSPFVAIRRTDHPPIWKGFPFFIACLRSTGPEESVGEKTFRNLTQWRIFFEKSIFSSVNPRDKTGPPPKHKWCTASNKVTRKVGFVQLLLAVSNDAMRSN